MANETEIIINQRSIRFIDTTSKQEYFSALIDKIRWKRDASDNFTFYNDVAIVGTTERLNQLGALPDDVGDIVGLSSFIYSTTLNPDTNAVFASADTMEAWLGTNTGFFFNPNAITTESITDLIANDGQNIIVSLQSLIEEQIKTNKLLSKIYNNE
jgi:hypothetical protein